MIFTRKSNYHESSEEGYTVCATKNDTEWKFTAWAPGKKMIDIFETSDEARGACDEHYKLRK